jgi:hypothetical protein
LHSAADIVQFSTTISIRRPAEVFAFLARFEETTDRR